MCLLWHGWLPSLACSGGASPWAAASVDDVADTRLERALGSYSDGVCGEWAPSDRFLVDLAILMCGLIVMLWMSCRV